MNSFGIGLDSDFREERGRKAARAAAGSRS
jgi:hypothetical protein